MYVPPSNAEHDVGAMLDFVAAHPFGALVTATADGPFATHLPFVVHRARDASGVLEGHVARANPHHRLAAVGDGLAIFTGPDAYVTPGWYAAKAEHGRVVPTWNYVAVHAYGTLRFVDEVAWLQRHLAELTDRHEAGRPAPWAVTDAPADYVAGLTRAIVGVELVVTRLEGKWKMSQNRPAADVDGVVHGLAASGSERERAVARIVAERRSGGRG